MAGDARLEQHGRHVGSLGPGSVVGELSLLDGGRSVVTVVATSRLELRVITRRAFCAAITDHPDLLARLLEDVAGHVRDGLAPHEWGAATYEPGIPPNMSTIRDANS